MKVKYDAPGSEVEKLFVLARKSFYISDPPKHEKEAIYEVNQRNSQWHHKQQRANPKYKIIQEAKKWKLYY